MSIDLTDATDAAWEVLYDDGHNGLDCRPEVSTLATAERMLRAALPHLEQQIREQVAAEAWDEGYSVGFYAREALPGDSRDASEGSGTNPYRTRKDADHE